ncbi:MAG: DUF6491 family protein [Gammaproteobacteria bacterium]|jgi:hypothetical protein
MLLGSIALSQDDEVPEIERCATVTDFIDVAVLDDRHVYLRTRGSNHYLFNLERCDDLHRAYLRTEVQLVPYGRQVCQNDGSYVAYLKSGRREHCLIQRVQRVQNRAEARELAQNPGSFITAEPVELDPQADGSASDEQSSQDVEED